MGRSRRRLGGWLTLSLRPALRRPGWDGRLVVGRPDVITRNG